MFLEGRSAGDFRRVPCAKTKKSAPSGLKGLPRRADTKNQRTNALVRRFQLIFTSCDAQRLAHIASLVHFSSSLGLQSYKGCRENPNFQARFF